jgi:hypothetical protein
MNQKFEKSLVNKTINNTKFKFSNLNFPRSNLNIRLKNAPEIMEKLWQIALTDVESNIVETEDGKYFGAGKIFGVVVFTRDISYSGVLGLNKLYPEIMKQSLRATRDVRLRLGFKVLKEYVLENIDVPWQPEEISEVGFAQKYHTNSYCRRTDDVVWLWAAYDLFSNHGTDEDWEWLYKTGNRFFKEFYDPFFDLNDNLYFGQASFIDIHGVGHKATGYPQNWDIKDCILIKALSTNCLYVRGLEVMSLVSNRLGHKKEAEKWNLRAENLRNAIRNELRNPDGTFSYFKDKNGELQPRREALGSALAVLMGIVKDEEARLALKNYPVTEAGVPLFHPFFPEDNYYHNNTSWPFVDTFFIKALEKSDGKDRTELNAALLARTCVDDGTFHEVVDFRNKKPGGSGSQLWTAASFIDVCFRAGLVKI